MIDRYYLTTDSGLVDTGYKVCDRQGREQEPVARVKDPEDGQRIVDLLNADERAKQPEQGPASAAGR